VDIMTICQLLPLVPPLPNFPVNLTQLTKKSKDNAYINWTYCC